MGVLTPFVLPPLPSLASELEVVFDPVCAVTCSLATISKLGVGFSGVSTPFAPPPPPSPARARKRRFLQRFNPVRAAYL